MSYRVPTGGLAGTDSQLQPRRGAAAVTLAFVLVALGAAGCASNQGYGEGPRGLTSARATVEDDDEESHPVPPDPYKGVRYRGGRDPGTGVAPRLNAAAADAPVPPPRYRSVATSRSDVPPPSAARTVPAGGPPALRAATPAPQAGAASIDVQPGDTLYSIATRNRTTVAALMQANGLASATIKPGQKLVLPQ